MNENMMECPKCGNVQPKNTEKCYKCGFRLNSYMEYLESVDTEINGSSVKCKDDQEIVLSKKQKAQKRGIKNPVFIIGCIIVLISLGSFIVYAINNGLFRKNDEKTIDEEQSYGLKTETDSTKMENFDGAVEGITDTKVIYKVKNEHFTEQEFDKSVEIMQKRADELFVDIEIQGNRSAGIINVRIP